MSSLAGCSTEMEAPPITIGGAFELNGGSDTALDATGSRGARMAVSELNKAGGVSGRQIVFIIEDTTSDPSTAVKAGERLAANDAIDAVVGFSDSSVALAAGPPIIASKQLLMVYGGTSPKLPAALGDLTFLACFGDNVQAAAGAEFGYRTFGKRAALLFESGEEYSLLLQDYFSKAYTTIGGTIALTAGYAGSSSDFSKEIDKVKALNPPPQFLYIAAYPNTIGLIVKQFREAGLMMPIVGGDGYDTPDLVAVAKQASDGVYFTTHAWIGPNQGNTRMGKFISAYQAEYGKAPENAFAALGYDSVMLLADAMTRANATDANAVQAALFKTTQFPAISGVISFAGGSRVPKKGVTVIALKDQAYTLAEEFVPDFIPDP